MNARTVVRVITIRKSFKVSTPRAFVRISAGLLALLLLFSIHSSTVSAQDEPAQPIESGLTVSTSPPGALVKLAGASTLMGLSPVFFGQGLPGNYKIEISSPGFETYSSTVTVTNTNVTSVSVTLKRRTRGKSAIRSMFWPGWGQFYSEQPTKGALMTTLAIAAGVSFAIAETRYQDKRDLYDVAYSNLAVAQAAGSLSELRPLELTLNAARSDAYDAESYRRAAIGATAAVWALSFLDALLFFPETKESPATRSLSSTSPSSQPGGTSLSLEPAFDPLAGKSGLSLSYRF